MFSENSITTNELWDLAYTVLHCSSLYLYGNISKFWVKVEGYVQNWHLRYKSSDRPISETKQSKLLFRVSIQEGQHPLTGQRAANFRILANQ